MIELDRQILYTRREFEAQKYKSKRTERDDGGETSAVRQRQRFKDKINGSSPGYRSRDEVRGYIVKSSTAGSLRARSD